MTFAYRNSLSVVGSAMLSLGLLASGACALEDVDGEGGNGEVDPRRIPADDPAVDERLDALDIACESTLTVTGANAPGNPPPDDHLGCWPVGEWTVTATIDRIGCDPQPDLSESMRYTITHDEENASINVLWANDPEDERVNLKISTAGDGLCHGAMEHFGGDTGDGFEVWAFYPTLQEDGSLVGTGTYSIYNVDPF